MIPKEFPTKEKIATDRKAIFLENNFQHFLNELRCRLPISVFICKNHEFHGKVLEIGAGSAWLSAFISKIPAVDQVYALDVSEEILNKIGKRVIVEMGADKEKIKFINSDFSKTPFKNNTFDVIVCDAALHHARNPKRLLLEMNRVLKDDGFFIAVREPIKPLIYSARFMQFGCKEIGLGANENIYNKKKWSGYFTDAGFTYDMFDEFNKKDFKTRLFRLPLLRNLNGIIFSRYYFFARKNIFNMDNRPDLTD